MNAKNKIFPLLLAMLICLVLEESQGQNLQAAIKGGVNFSNLFIEDLNTEDSRFGYNAGAFLQIPLGQLFFLQPEGVFNTRGANVLFEDPLLRGETELQLNYVDFPILGGFRLLHIAEITLGPYVGYLADFDMEIESNNLSVGFNDLDEDNFKRVDVGFAAGLAANFKKFQLGLQYTQGFRDIEDKGSADELLGDAKNSLVQIYLAYVFLGR